MKVAFDAKRALCNTTGLGNYSRYVINNLVDVYPDNEYVLYTPRQKRELSLRIVPSPAISFCYPENFPWYTVPSLWRSYGIPLSLQREKIELFHGLSNELPLNIREVDIPAVVTIHDLIFLHYPQFYSFIDRKVYEYKFRQACLQSDRIIAVSEMTRRDICTLFRIPENKIEVVHQGCDSIFFRTVTQEERQSLRNKYNLSAPYILFVGSIEERKNLLLVIQALENIREDIQLVAIGRQTSYLKRIQAYLRPRSKLASRVRLLHHVPNTDLPAFYQSAELFLYPSFFEGFGIPVLEALASNTPVIAATGSCLEEAGGGGSLYTDPANPEELASLIRAVLTQPALARTMREMGRAHVTRFSSQRLIGKLFSLYQHLI
ncbi:MAG: glycosyltransferase family 4 protein [Tannerellaceae bacterium]|jgi:glycosyltransferase involved in cell wall biosynthesis|nr:glycosyltransferase family 4 protein [Tannerellaceae bacterium]